MRPEPQLAVVEGERFRPWFMPRDLPEQLADAFEWHGPDATACAPALIAVQGRLLVIVPRFFAAVGANQGGVEATIRTLVAAHREAKRRSAEALDLELSWAGAGVSDLFDRLEAALLLWSDYTANGRLFLTEQRISTTVRGRIHWPRTIRGQAPAFSGPSVVYAHPLRTRVGLVPEHPLTMLHKRACDEAGQLLGWRPPAGRPFLPVEALDILEASAQRLFQDRHIRVWRALRRFYTGATYARSPERERGRGCVSRSFPHIWERMLDVALAPTVRPRMAEGTYQLANGESTRGLRLRPDTVIREGELWFIIDAKDYAAGAWPSSHSINKQILYRLSLSDALGFGDVPVDKIINAFVRPLALNPGSPVAYLGAHVLGHDREDIGTIHCLGVDFETVAAAYSSGRAAHRLRGLVREELTAERRA